MKKKYPLFVGGSKFAIDYYQRELFCGKVTKLAED
jgi:hypothetical protein